MAASLPSVVRTLADRVLPVATHTTAARAAPLSCADRQARLISRGTDRIRQAFLPASTTSRSGNRRRSAAQLLTCMAASQPFTLVGSGRVGKALADLGAGDDVIIKRGEKVDGPEGPIVVATRNNDLQGVVDATPPERREDLIFIQNGMLQPWLDEKGLGDNTQVLVYFAVAKLGDAPIDGKTDTNPEGLTAAVGKHAEAFAARLSTADLSCKVLDRVEFKKSMLEKLIWICAIMVVGARHGNISVGEVESQHTQEVTAPMLSDRRIPMADVETHCCCIQLHQAAAQQSQ